MALVCSKSVYLSPDIERIIVDLDVKIDNHYGKVEDLEKSLTKNKLKMYSIELNSAQQKLRAQEREVRSLRDRNKQLETESGVENESLDTLRDKEQEEYNLEKSYYTERKNVCLETYFANEDAKKSALYQDINNLKKETSSLRRKINSKDIEISQLRFRNNLLCDTLKESKSGKNVEKAFLQKVIALLQEDNLIKDEELAKLRLELKSAQEWKVHMTTDNCAVNVKLREHEQEIKELQETIRHVTFQNNECQRALDQSLQKEAELKKTLLQLNGENKEKENMIHTIGNRLNRFIGIVHDKETEIEKVTRSYERVIKQLEDRLEQSNTDIMKGKVQANTAQEGISNEMESFKDELNEKEIALQSIQAQMKQSFKINDDKAAKLNGIIGQQNRVMNHLQMELETRPLNHTIQTRSRHAVEEQEDIQISEIKHKTEGNKKLLQDFLKLQEENEFKRNLIISHKDSQIQKVSEDIKKNNLTELKCPLKGITEASQQMESDSKDRKENELKHIISSIEQQLKNSEAKMRQQQLDISHEKALMSAKDKDMMLLGVEIKKIKLEVKQKESMLQKCSEQYKDAVNLKQEAESKLNDIINTHKTEIRHLQRDIERKDSELAKIDQEKGQYKQDIANAKQHSKAAQKKISKMGTRINGLIKQLKTNEEELHKGEEKLGNTIDSQKEHIRHLERDAQKQERKIESVEIGKNNELEQMENNFDELENKIKHMLLKLHDTDAELDKTKLRLSRVMEDKLTDNSLNLTDLSDRNRPTKIAEKCTELYENEWIYVLKRLFRTEQTAIEALLLILQNTMLFCKTMARRQIEIIERELYFADENEQIAVSSLAAAYIQKIIKDRRKATATDAVRNLKKIYVAQLKKSKDEIMRAALDVEPYTLECIEICWLMLIQDPPVVFAPLPIKDSSFNSEFYKPYTKSGTHVDFAVWPALLLHDGGPILAKGVAQGYENK